MPDVARRSGDEVVERDDLAFVVEQALAQVRAEESGASGDDDFRHSGLQFTDSHGRRGATSCPMDSLLPLLLDAALPPGPSEGMRPAARSLTADAACGAHARRS